MTPILLILIGWVDSRHSLTLFRWITDNECHVIWLDNLNKMCRTRMIDMFKNTGTLQKMNWTGIATKRFAFPDQVDDSVMRDVAGQIIPGVASNPFAYQRTTQPLVPNDIEQRTRESHGISALERGQPDARVECPNGTAETRGVQNERSSQARLPRIPR